MAVSEHVSDGSEGDLIAVLDTGCNTTCHGGKWLARYLKATSQQEPQLLPDNAGGLNWRHHRHIWHMELTDGTLAKGSLHSVELANSDAPLLLSLEAQRRLGLVLDLNRAIAHSEALGGDLQLVSHNGLYGLRLLPGGFAGLGLCNPSDRHMDFQDEAADDHPSGADPMQVDDHTLGADPAAGEQTLGYLAYDELKVHSMSKSQANKVKANFDVVSKKDKLMWNQMCPKYLRKRPCLHGCKTFLMEIFAGCAVLTSVAHFAHGYPTSEPIDVLYDPVYDLTTAAGRAAVDERIARDDPYLLTFAPVCGPWSPWQHINMSKSEDMRFKVLEDRKKWLPVVKWICGHARKRLQRGRQVLIENPAPSAIWETTEMDKLLNHEGHYDQIIGEALE